MEEQRQNENSSAKVVVDSDMEVRDELMIFDFHIGIDYSGGESPESGNAGLWSISNHLRLIDELQVISYPNEDEVSFHRIISHARLSRLYGAAGNDQMKNEHLNKSVSLLSSSRFAAKYGITDESSLMAMLKTLDEKDLP